MKVNKKYINNLKFIASLSPIFSSNDIPLVSYRAHENIFCDAFAAENLSRSDIAVDAKIGNVGYGLKTFMCKSNKTMQKIAEFNKLSHKLNDLDDYDIVQKIIEWRNQRIEFSNKTYGIQKNLYHCLVRKQNKIGIHEEELEKISSDFKITKSTNSSIIFVSDDKIYSYNRSKSTLLRQFNIDEKIKMYEIKFIDDPFAWINEHSSVDFDAIILPLYSAKDGNVPKRSQLNQWNASGRKRDNLEVYIPIPAIVRDNCPNFFPPDNHSFDLTLPNNKIISVRVCQQGGKALMSNPNRDLGEWLLRDLFKLKDNELMTREKLNIIGIDSVEITKEKNHYSIDFRETGSYEEFLEGIIERRDILDV